VFEIDEKIKFLKSLPADEIVDTIIMARDKSEIVKEIIEELSKEHDGCAPLDEILSESEKAEIDKQSTIDIIARLMTSGDIFEPKAGWYTAVKSWQ
jgi:DNA replicative helicase MCM subunit Mcm2 (Cdc46/Mcm family)